MAYELNLEKFKGPLEKLLELIEEKKLEITEISLATVTDDFIKYLKTLTDADKTRTDAESDVSEGRREVRESLRLMADFVAVASRLLLIKSKSLLPDASLTSEEEAEIKDLEFRLKRYRELKQVMKALAKEWRAGEQSFARPYFLNAMSGVKSVKVFYPGTHLTPEALAASLEKILEGFQRFVSEEGTVEAEIISIESKIQEIVTRMQKRGELSFGTLSQKNSRIEIITAFLAILHMAHDQLILLEQAAHFSDITIKLRSKSAD